MRETFVNGRWPLLLPDHRAARPQWPWWEAARIAAMHHHIGGGGHVVYDIGAEEGDMSALWASWGNEVVVVEPNPKAWPCIRATFEANELTDRIRAWWVGFCGHRAWEVDPDPIPLRCGTDGWPACARDGMVPDHGFHHIAEHEPVTPSVTLDQLVDATGVAPTAITMDVEGAELYVLRGAARTLAEHRPKVWVSVHPDFMRHLYAHDPDEVHQLMADAGYEREYLATDHEEHWMYTPR